MTLMLARDATRRTPWFSMPVAQAERRRWRPIPVAEIVTVQKEMAARKARIAKLEAEIAAQQPKQPNAKRRDPRSKARRKG